MGKHSVTYTGVGERIISAKDWKSIDIEGEEMRWVPATLGQQASLELELTDEQLDYFKNRDANFKVSAVKDDGTDPANSDDARSAAKPDEDADADDTEGDAEGTLASASSPRTSGRGTRTR